VVFYSLQYLRVLLFGSQVVFYSLGYLHAMLWHLRALLFGIFSMIVATFHETIADSD
jgi:uncharacterized protein involved in response to NO